MARAAGCRLRQNDDSHTRSSNLLCRAAEQLNAEDAELKREAQRRTRPFSATSFCSLRTLR